MTNQQYIEEIRKVAQQGGWELKPEMFQVEWQEEPLEIYLFKLAFLNPKFFRAIGKVKGWRRKPDKLVSWCYGGIHDADKPYEEWIYYMHTFLDKIIEKDLDHAIEWLYNLIKE